MNAFVPSSSQVHKAAAVILLTTASVGLSFGFACAVPLAAFATLSAFLFTPRAALGAILSVWLTNQIVGFVFLNYPIDASTFAWGAALGVIAVGSLGAALAILDHRQGTMGAGLALIGAFFVYEGALYAVSLASGAGTAHFTMAIVTRIAFINLAAFVGIFALWRLALRTEIGRGIGAALRLRHA